MKSIDAYHLNVNHVGLAASIASITMFFAALALAFGLRIHESPASLRFEVPALLWMSTGALAVSSASLEFAKYSLRRGRVQAYRLWMGVTAACATVFLLLQIASA